MVQEHEHDEVKSNPPVANRPRINSLVFVGTSKKVSASNVRDCWRRCWFIPVKGSCWSSPIDEEPVSTICCMEFTFPRWVWSIQGALRVHASRSIRDTFNAYL